MIPDNDDDFPPEEAHATSALAKPLTAEELELLADMNGDDEGHDYTKVIMSFDSLSLETAQTLLRQFELNVRFTKVDGTIRDMRASLRPDVLTNALGDDFAEDSIPKNTATTVSVWDLDKAAWRSFRLDSVLQIKYTTEARGITTEVTMKRGFYNGQ